MNLLNPRHRRIFWRKNVEPYLWAYVLCFIFGLLLAGLIELLILKQKPVKLIDPMVRSRSVSEPTASPSAQKRSITGLASYYSLEGCLGCREDRLMANGEVLDDTHATIAYNHAPLNLKIKITNLGNNRQIYAKLTDRGGFERHGKIADLSVATKEALGCGDVCRIELEL